MEAFGVLDYPFDSCVLLRTLVHVDVSPAPGNGFRTLVYVCKLVARQSYWAVDVQSAILVHFFVFVDRVSCNLRYWQFTWVVGKLKHQIPRPVPVPHMRVDQPDIYITCKV